MKVGHVPLTPQTDIRLPRTAPAAGNGEAVEPLHIGTVHALADAFGEREPNLARQVGKGMVAIGQHRPEANDNFLFSTGAGDTVILTLYNVAKRKGALAHVDRVTEVQIDEMLKKVGKAIGYSGRNGQDIRAHMIGGVWLGGGPDIGAAVKSGLEDRGLSARWDYWSSSPCYLRRYGAILDLAQGNLNVFEEGRCFDTVCDESDNRSKLLVTDLDRRAQGTMPSDSRLYPMTLEASHRFGHSVLFTPATSPDSSSLSNRAVDTPSQANRSAASSRQSMASESAWDFSRQNSNIDASPALSRQSSVSSTSFYLGQEAGSDSPVPSRHPGAGFDGIENLLGQSPSLGPSARSLRVDTPTSRERARHLSGLSDVSGSSTSSNRVANLYQFYGANFTLRSEAVGGAAFRRAARIAFAEQINGLQSDEAASGRQSSASAQSSASSRASRLSTRMLPPGIQLQQVEAFLQSFLISFNREQGSDLALTFYSPRGTPEVSGTPTPGPIASERQAHTLPVKKSPVFEKQLQDLKQYPDADRRIQILETVIAKLSQIDARTQVQLFVTDAHTAYVNMFKGTKDQAAIVDLFGAREKKLYSSVLPDFEGTGGGKGKWRIIHKRTDQAIGILGIFDTHEKGAYERFK